MLDRLEVQVAGPVHGGGGGSGTWKDELWISQPLVVVCLALGGGRVGYQPTQVFLPSREEPCALASGVLRSTEEYNTSAVR